MQSQTKMFDLRFGERELRLDANVGGLYDCRLWLVLTPKPHLTIDVCPPSVNDKIASKWRAAPAITAFRKHVECTINEQRFNVPEPPVVVAYSIEYNDKRRDTHNGQKVLLDALYKNDRRVYPFCIASEFVTRASKGVDLWFFPIRL